LTAVATVAMFVYALVIEGDLVVALGAAAMVFVFGAVMASQFAEQAARSVSQLHRSPRIGIPERVRHEVWRRDHGCCARCGSRERLEYDHIIPVSRGGSNTARNVELLCERCNRAKGASVG
jgi:hypothetical protein